MFSLIRLALGCLFFGCCLYALRQFTVIGKRRRYIITTLITVCVFVISAFIPFENAFITFDSPEVAYGYYNFGSNDIRGVVDGVGCDLVIGDKKGTDVLFIVPKTKDGWKVGIGVDTKRIAKKINNNLIIYVYQYKNSSDYFLSIVNTAGGPCELTDSNNSVFYTLERRNEVLEKSIITYYASVPNLDNDYQLNVNGDLIPVF